MIRYILCQDWDGYMMYGKICLYRCPFPVDIGDHLLVHPGRCVVVIDPDPPRFRIRKIEKLGYWKALRILGRFPGPFDQARLTQKEYKAWLAEQERKHENDGRRRKNRRKKDEEEM